MILRPSVPATCAALLALACAASVRPAVHPPAHPPAQAPVRTLALSLVKERAVCPIEVVVDHDPARTPQRIKMLKCARDPLARCLATGVTRAHCCDWRDADHVAGCVEIIDYVAVTFRSEGAPREVEAYAVSVGCACMPVPTTEAAED